MVLEKAKRLVEAKKDVVILLDSITRLARRITRSFRIPGRSSPAALTPTRSISRSDSSVRRGTSRRAEA